MTLKVAWARLFHDFCSVRAADSEQCLAFVGATNATFVSYLPVCELLSKCLVDVQCSGVQQHVAMAIVSTF